MQSYVRSMTTIPEEDSEETEDGRIARRSAWKEMAHTLLDMMDLSLLKDPGFSLYCLVSFLAMVGECDDNVYNLVSCIAMVGKYDDNVYNLVSFMAMTGECDENLPIIELAMWRDVARIYVCITCVR